ncbi:MAG: hypothetical protein OXF21_05225 [bacterium]|nr:hypothetical protein [bacterium]
MVPATHRHLVTGVGVRALLGSVILCVVLLLVVDAAALGATEIQGALRGLTAEPVAQDIAQNTAQDIDGGSDADLPVSNSAESDSDDELQVLIAALIVIAVIALLGTFIYWRRSDTQATPVESTDGR